MALTVAAVVLVASCTSFGSSSSDDGAGDAGEAGASPDAEADAADLIDAAPVVSRVVDFEQGTLVGMGGADSLTDPDGGLTLVSPGLRGAHAARVLTSTGDTFLGVLVAGAPTAMAVACRFRPGGFPSAGRRARIVAIRAAAGGAVVASLWVESSYRLSLEYGSTAAGNAQLLGQTSYDLAANSVYKIALAVEGSGGGPVTLSASLIRDADGPLAAPFARQTVPNATSQVLGSVVVGTTTSDPMSAVFDDITIADRPTILP